MKLFLAAVFLLTVLPAKATDVRSFDPRPLKLERPFANGPETTIPIRSEDWWMAPAIQREVKLPVREFRAYQKELDAPGPGYREQAGLNAETLLK